MTSRWGLEQVGERNVSTPIPIGEATPLVRDRMDINDLESIVRALAAAPIEDGPDTWCRLCARDMGDHSGFCPWRRAREWVERNGHG